MGKKLKGFALLSLICILGMGNINIYAAETHYMEIPENKTEVSSVMSDFADTLASPSLSACNVWVGIADNGLLVTFDTTATQVADEIGVKNVIIQEKTWYGGWKDIPISNYYRNNSSYYMTDIVYTGATKGTTYRVKCTHYAKFGSTELTLNSTSSELTYN